MIERAESDQELGLVFRKNSKTEKTIGNQSSHGHPRRWSAVYMKDFLSDLRGDFLSSFSSSSSSSFSSFWS